MTRWSCVDVRVMTLEMPSLLSVSLGRALELRRVVHRADAHDDRLAGHQTRAQVDGAEAAGVGQRDRDAGEVVHRQLAVAGAADDVLVGLPELEEVPASRPS